LQSKFFYGFGSFISVFLLVVFSGCSPREQNTKPLVKHMIQSQKLRLLMRELDLVVYEPQKSELERDEIRKRYALTLADTLKRLSVEVENMSKSDLGSNLAANDFDAYKKHAKLLNKNANELYELAQNYKFELIDKKMQDVKISCDSCHNHFRQNL
jgi:hypothetical protein